MDIRYYVDADSGLPHIYNHGVSEADVKYVLKHATEDRPGRDGSRIAWVPESRLASPLAAGICG